MDRGEPSVTLKIPALPEKDDPNARRESVSYTACARHLAKPTSRCKSWKAAVREGVNIIVLAQDRISTRHPFRLAPWTGISVNLSDARGYTCASEMNKQTPERESERWSAAVEGDM